MSEKESFQSVWLPLIIFIGLGAAFVGVESIAPQQQFVIMDGSCAKYFTDEDGDGQSGMIEDQDCFDYPYEDGGGEFGTPPQAMGQSSDTYQTYYDLTVDLVRLFVDKQCNNNLNNCVGTNFQYETQFYCFFSANIMAIEFRDIIDKFYNVIQVLPDDGSYSKVLNICHQLGGFQGQELKEINHQITNPIPENPSGSSAKPGKPGGGQQTAPLV